MFLCSWLHSRAVANIGVCMSISIYIFWQAVLLPIVGEKADNPIIYVIQNLQQKDTIFIVFYMLNSNQRAATCNHDRLKY